MKINEIITEGHNGKIPDNAKNSNTGEWKFRDKGGYDRTYNLNRVMMAAAMSDGSGKPVDMDQSSWVEKFNLARPYTEAEHSMMKSAMKTVDSEYKETEKDHKSKEDDDVHKNSSVPHNSGAKRNKPKN